jgi:Phage integrase, N-terminal SAM-like domain
MVEKNPLHRRMIHDVQLPNLSPVTQRCYVHTLARFAHRSNQSPGQLELAEICPYQIRLTTTGISWIALHRRVRSADFAPIQPMLWNASLPECTLPVKKGSPRTGEAARLNFGGRAASALNPCLGRDPYLNNSPSPSQTGLLIHRLLSTDCGARSVRDRTYERLLRANEALEKSRE